MAFLRGINVGRAKRSGMSDVRHVFSSCGYADVRTVINSGNVIFSASSRLTARSVKAIEDALQKQTGISSRILVLDRDELRAVVKGNTLLRHMTDEARMMVTLMFPGVNARSVAPPAAESIAPDRLHATQRAVYTWLPDGLMHSRIPAEYWRGFKDATTQRNWRTLAKLLALME
ncbi:MAG: DUF1697 domain-containing protein [Candidatus Dormibacteraeota bacterium]|nr:DUF1697 domain-containing protein [Candidatus Dormibacteraeota bacterium]